MSVVLVIGPAQSGKSAWIREQFLEEAHQLRKGRTLLLVPEQINFLKQQHFAAYAPGKVLFHADVLSFRRLAVRLMQQKGGSGTQLLDEVGKSLLLYQSSRKAADKLQYYGASYQTKGFLQRLKSMLSELAQYEVPRTQLEAALEAETGNETLHAKLSDLLLLQEQYEQALDKAGCVSEKILDDCLDTLKNSSYLENASVYIDDFYDFNPQQMRFLSVLMKKAAKTVITVTLPVQEGKRIAALTPEELAGSGGRVPEKHPDHFSRSRRTLWDLLEMVRGLKQKLDTVYLDEYGNDPIRHLAREFFRIPSRPWNGPQHQVALYAAQDARHEVRFVMDRILDLVREEGYSFREIGIACGDPSQYELLLRQSAQEYQIPLFMDEKQSVLAQPLVRMVLSLLQMVRTRCRYEAFFAFLKSGFTPLSRDQIDRMENEALKEGWNGFGHFREQIRIEAAGSEKEKTILGWLSCLEEFLNDTHRQETFTAGEWCERVQRFLQAVAAREQMVSSAQQLREEGRLLSAAAADQIYDKMEEVFERILQICPQEELDAEGFHTLLGIGLSELKLGVLPGRPEQVNVGDFERSRFRGLRALFILGFDEASFPRLHEGSSLLTEQERAHLSERIVLAPTRTQQLYDQQFHLYMLLASPMDHLYVSYDASPVKGERRSPSIYWNRFLQIFGGKVLQNAQNTLPALAEPAFSDYLEQKEKDPVMADWFWNHGYAERMVKLAQAGSLPEERLSEEQAHELWQPWNWELSVSQLTEYANCPYRHFLHYGIRLEKREQFETSLMDDGLILHDVLEKAGDQLRQAYDPNQKTDEAVDALFAQIRSRYPNYQDTARHRYFWSQLEKKAQQALMTLKEQIEIGSFDPTYFEWKFGSGEGCLLPPFEVPLSDGSLLHMRGVIDRVDLLEESNGTYIRVIDYKSGNTVFHEDEVADGIALQLPVYLEAAQRGLRQMGKTPHPAGIFYFHLKPSIAKNDKISENTSKEEIVKAFKKESRMNGIMSSDPAAMKGMAGDPGMLNSLLPIRMTKKGINKQDIGKVRSEQELTAMGRFTQRKIAQMAEEILKGTVEPRPYRKTQSYACDYCDYRDTCLYDRVYSGQNDRMQAKGEGKRIWEEPD